MQSYGSSQLRSRDWHPQEILNRYRDAWKAGYYSCLAHEMAGGILAPAVTKGVETAGVALIENSSVGELRVHSGVSAKETEDSRRGADHPKS